MQTAEERPVSPTADGERAPAEEQVSRRKSGRNNRVHILDTLRGFSILYVMLYHLLYDLIFFCGADIPFFFSDAMEIIHRFFLVILFSVSGICAGFSGNVLKRGAVLYLLGEMLTLFTAAFVPGETIVFGVLSCFGMTMLIYGVISPALKKIPNAVIFAVFAVLAVIFTDFYRTGSLFLVFGRIKLDVPQNLHWLYPIGITSSDFRSADYFPLVPYSFIFFAGTALSDIVGSGGLPEFCYKAKIPIVNFCGKYSLRFYIIHQPVFLALTHIIGALKK
ncbi:MAG: DUF1624 domain-containing protein [Prevotella sp.]|nr:DUF1624 domain-containing protein [Prevotella sp.]